LAASAQTHFLNLNPFAIFAEILNISGQFTDSAGEVQTAANRSSIPQEFLKSHQ